MSRYLVIPAAGGGERLAAGTPKALVPIAGRPMLAIAAEAFGPLRLAGAAVAAPPGREAEIRRCLPSSWIVVAGGASRAESVERALAALSPADSDVIVIHDAARPFVRSDEIESVVAEAERSGAAIAVIPVVDTLKRAAGATIVGTLNRDEVVAAATPQAFRLDLLRRALEASDRSTDEAARLEAAGIPVAAVPVSRLAFKITYPEDLRIAEAIAAAFAAGKSG